MSETNNKVIKKVQYKGHTIHVHSDYTCKVTRRGHSLHEPNAVWGSALHLPLARRMVDRRTKKDANSGLVWDNMRHHLRGGAK